MSVIKKLPDALINQIAAGEVVEKPASVVKELVENSIDAGATKISIYANDGGKNFIKVVDNGSGIAKDELSLAIQRHATSKLSHENLMKITTMGFRGEALPSIGSVSRMKIKSKIESGEPWEISVEGGTMSEVKPSNCENGTVIEIKDLFYAVPARLKFLKTVRIEKDAILDVLQRVALANPHVALSYTHDSKLVFNYMGREKIARISEIMGKEFADNALEIAYSENDCTVTGYAALPTLHRSYARFQYFFVNGRPVKDKILFAAVKIAYQDFLPHGRHPMLVLSIDLPESDVDVNVHPAKTEVRFQNAAHVRDAVRRALREMLQGISYQATSTNSDHMTKIFQQNLSVPKSSLDFQERQFTTQYQQLNEQAPTYEAAPMFTSPPEAKFEQTGEVAANTEVYPLGAAKAQIHKNYIIAQNEKGLVIIDQHAAHERLVYEKLKKNLRENKIERQLLLVPEMVGLPDADLEMLLAYQADLAEYGLGIEKFGVGTLLIREVPSLIQKGDFKALIQDLVDELRDSGTTTSLKDRIEFVCATIACHGSVRSGRILNADEMNQLLRDMEATPYSGQCNHGRPTYIELDLDQIEKLFGRQGVVNNK